MAEREELILEVEVDTGRAKSDLEGVERAAGDVEDAFEDTSTAAERAGRAIVEAAEKSRTEMVQQKAAVDALANALGPELAAKANLDSVVVDLQRMGLTLEDIRAEADTLAAAMKQVDDVRLQGLSQGVDITRQRMDGLTSSSNQSRSVLANLAGNSAQDIGQLGGVVGSLGVGIGQLAEYAVDGNIKLNQLASVAGPMLGLVFASQAVSTALAGIKAEDAFRADLVDDFRDSLKDAEDAATALRDRIIETGRLDFSDEGGFIGLGQQTEDLIPVLARLGLSFEDFMNLVQLSASGSREEVDAFLATLSAGGTQFGSFNADADALTDGIDQYGDAIAAAEAGQAAFNQVIGESTFGDINQAIQDYTDQLSHVDELWKIVMQDFADNQSIDTASEQWNRLKEILQLTDAEMVELADQKLDERLDAEAEAAKAAADAQREHAAAIQETVQAFDDYLAGFDPAASRLAGFSAALETVNRHFSELDASQQTIAFNDDLRTLHETLHDLDDALTDSELADLDLVPDSWEEVRNMPEELKPVVDALSGFRDTMQSEFAQAFEQGGSTEARQWAENTRAAVVNELRLAGIEAPEQVNEILSALGLLPDQVTTTIQISEAEQARQILSDIGGLIESIPPSVQREVALEIIAGDPEAALALVQTALNSAPSPEVPVTLVPDPNQKSFGADLAALLIETEPDLAAIEVIDDAVAEERVAAIGTEADLVGITDIDNAVAIERTADVDVNALLGDFEREMTFAVRDRTATVDVGTGSVSLPSASQLVSLVTGGQGRIVVPIVGR